MTAANSIRRLLKPMGYSPDRLPAKDLPQMVLLFCALGPKNATARTMTPSQIAAAAAIVNTLQNHFMRNEFNRRKSHGRDAARESAKPLKASRRAIVARGISLRIEVGPGKVKLQLPRMRGPLPLIGFIRAELPYDAVASVECREEIYVSFGLVTAQMAYSLVTRDGRRFLLGAMTQNWDAPWPIDKAADQIALHAGLRIVDHGAVRVGGIIRAVAHGTPPWSAPAMPPTERRRWDRRAVLSVQLLIGLLGVIAALRACSGSSSH